MLDKIFKARMPQRFIQIQCIYTVKNHKFILGEMVREGSGVFMLRSLSSACFICGYGNTFDGLATNSISLLATCLCFQNVDGHAEKP